MQAHAANCTISRFAQTLSRTPFLLSVYPFSSTPDRTSPIANFRLPFQKRRLHPRTGHSSRPGTYTAQSAAISLGPRWVSSSSPSRLPPYRTPSSPLLCSALPHSAHATKHPWIPPPASPYQALALLHISLTMTTSQYHPSMLGVRGRCLRPRLHSLLLTSLGYQI